MAHFLPIFSIFSIFALRTNSSYRMAKLIALILLLAGVASAYYGYQMYQDATADISVLGIDIEASDKAVKQQSFLFLGLGVVGIVAGLMTWKRG